MKKRILSMLAAIAVAVSLSACRANDTGQVPPLIDSVVSEKTQFISETIQPLETTAIENSEETLVEENNETILIADKHYDINTEELILCGVDLTNDDLKKLLFFNNLKGLKLDLYSCEQDTLNLDVLSNLSSVENLYINGTYVDLSFISGMTNLKSLVLEHFFCETLENIPTNSTVTSFSCSQSSISDLRWLTNFEKLEELSLSHFVCTDYAPIGKNTNLKALTMVMIDEYDVDLQFIKNLTSLEKFNYYPIYKTVNLDSISQCYKLTDLEMHADIDNINFISDLSNLKTFSFYANNHNFYNISVLQDCKNLKNVSLACQYIKEDLTQLKQLLPECEFN